MDLTGCRVSFRVKAVVHPDPATVHDTFCQEMELGGICEHYIEEGLDGGPFLMVRIDPDKPPVLVALKNVEKVISKRDLHEKGR